MNATEKLLSQFTTAQREGLLRETAVQSSLFEGGKPVIVVLHDLAETIREMRGETESTY